MDKAITSGLLIIASIIASIALINAVIPAMSKSSGALVTANSEAADRIRTDIEVIHVASDTSGDPDQVIVWVKNIGLNTITSIDSGDVFLTTPTEVKRLSYGSASGSEYWDYSIEGATEWTQTVTVKMTLYLTNGSVTAGGYNVIVNVYNSVNASKDFSV